MRTKRGLLVCAVLGAALLAGGCGSEAFPKAQTTVTPTTARGKAAAAQAATPRGRLLAAVDRVTAARTAKLTITATVSGVGDQDGSITGSGAVDFANRRMALVMDAGLGGDAFHMEIRLVGGTVYENQGDGWTSMSVAGAAPTDLPDVQSYLQYLRGVTNDVRVDGREIVRGAETTRYVATVDLGHLAQQSATSAPLQQALAMFGGVKIPFTVWVDDAGRVRKLQMSLDLAAFAQRLGDTSGLAPKVDMTMELYDFGVPVDVQAPAGAKSQATVEQDRRAQSDLRNALTAEKTYYTDNEAYTTDLVQLREIEPSLDWGGKLKVVATGDGSAVCVSEASASGTTFGLYDDAASMTAGTYYGKAVCPAVLGATPSGFVPTGW